MPIRAAAVEAGSAPQEPAEPPATPETGGDGSERRRHPRIAVGPTESAATALRSAERRSNPDRRSAGLRDNVGWTVTTNPGRRASDRRSLHLKKSRIFVLGFALVAGGIAAYLAHQIGRPAPAPAPVVVEKPLTTQVLVASQPIAAGQRLSAAMLTWQAWPEQALQPDYITAAATPAATSDLSGLTARSDFLPGDPIRRQKLTKDTGGFLSANLGKGMRGVSVVVTAESASGGFISPDDRVDVVLTRTPAGGIGGATPRSETILRNVRVLAINGKTPTPDTAGASAEKHDTVFSGQAIATLALDPAQADLVVSAAAIGKLSLLLRPLGSAESATAATAQTSLNQAIRLSSPFWAQ